MCGVADTSKNLVGIVRLRKTSGLASQQTVSNTPLDALPRLQHCSIQQLMIWSTEHRAPCLHTVSLCWVGNHFVIRGTSVSRNCAAGA